MKFVPMPPVKERAPKPNTMTTVPRTTSVMSPASNLFTAACSRNLYSSLGAIFQYIGSVVEGLAARQWLTKRSKSAAKPFSAAFPESEYTATLSGSAEYPQPPMS